jgi:hypothetical protein
MCYWNISPYPEYFTGVSGFAAAWIGNAVFHDVDQLQAFVRLPRQQRPGIQCQTAAVEIHLNFSEPSMKNSNGCVARPAIRTAFPLEYCYRLK